jgi:polysaccharide biosynthesis/export protein
MKELHAMRAIVMSMIFAAVLALPAAAQTGASSSAGLHVTRAELQEMLARYEAAAAGGGQTGAAAAEAATLIRQRLEEGDLRIGDRILVVVEGYPQFSDTFHVVTGRRIVMPEIGDVPLAGVLRAEVEDHIRRAVGTYLRNPTVHARTLVRMEIRGAIGRPGFYAVPADMLLSDALMIAGGPGARANLERVSIYRGRQVLWEGARLRTAMIEGRTLDQLGVQAGDGILVPEQRGPMWREGLAIVSAGASLIYLLRRIGAL